MHSDDTVQWFAALPLGEPVEIDDETVYLDVRPGGAILGAHLLASHTQAQLQQALKYGFQSAIHFDAGLGESTDGNSLVLTQWLPNVTDWSGAVEALENLLNQVGMWREALTPQVSASNGKEANRTEERLRRLFAGAR